MSTNATEPTARPWMTLSDLSQYLAIPENTLRRWRSAGTGPPARKFGRHLRYGREEVAAWIEDQSPSART